MNAVVNEAEEDSDRAYMRLCIEKERTAKRNLSPVRNHEVSSKERRTVVPKLHGFNNLVPSNGVLSRSECDSNRTPRGREIRKDIYYTLN